MSTVKATNFQNASSATANMVTDASGNVSFGGTAAMSSSFLRNRIINGDMRIDQRNAGASITPTNSQYSVDRWQGALSVASKFSLQQSSTAPAGFVNSILVTSLSAYTVGSTEQFAILQPIEGLNMSDVGFGAAGASTLTLSFWVRSSLTGTFGGSLINYSNNRSYPFNYTINVANTFEQKTITITGDTTGTWATTNTGWGQVWFGLGVGSTKSTTAGAWAAGAYYSATGATSVVGTSGATFYITGVQLEVGTVATPFERQIYNAQLAQCQRYYYRIGPVASQAVFGPAVADTTTAGRSTGSFPVTMRTSPTALEQTGTAGNYVIRTGGTSRTCSAVPTFDSATENIWQINTTVASGQTAGQGGFFRADAITTAYLAWSAEL